MLRLLNTKILLLQCGTLEDKIKLDLYGAIIIRTLKVYLLLI